MYLLFFLSVSILSLVPQIEVEAPRGSLTVRTVKEKKTSYLLLTKEEPISFRVEGPVYLRVYSRLLYVKDDKEPRTYKIIVQEDETRERIYSKTTEPSLVSFFNDSPVGKWRRIPIRVPPGKHAYKLILYESPYPVAIRLVPGSPPTWSWVQPEQSLERVTTIEGEKLIHYLLLTTDSSLKVRVKGPSTLKIELRSNFTPGMGKSDRFTLRLTEGGKDLKTVDFSVYPSQIATWQERPEWRPSKKVGTTSFIPSGMHEIEVKVTGSLSPKVALRILKEGGKGG